MSGFEGNVWSNTKQATRKCRIGSEPNNLGFKFEADLTGFDIN